MIVSVKPEELFLNFRRTRCNMKKNMVGVFSVLLTITTVLSCLGGCKPPQGGPVTEEIDPTKTQLYVFTYDGGYGSEWLYKIKERFEAVHANDTNWEDGKTGVQIVPNPSKSAVTDNVIRTTRDEIYITEGAEYYQYINSGAIGDITEAVTQPNPYDGGKTIAEKFTPEQADYYGVDDGGAIRYYGLPVYGGYYGIVYNVDLFEEKGYYIRADATDFTSDDGFTASFVGDDKTAARSAGPDGESGTDDDGLPVTYDEFFALCKYIALDSGEGPLIWTGDVYAQYLAGLFNSLAAANMGYDEMRLIYTMDGMPQSLGKVENGTFVKDSPQPGIDTSNGYEMMRSEGIYDALGFLERLIREKYADTNYWRENSFTSGYTHMNAQEYFLREDCPMLVDGVWWESEASDTFTAMEQSQGASYSKENRHFGWMPLPKSSNAAAGENFAVADVMLSLCIMKADIAEWKKPLAFDFIQFMYSDESLVEFTELTSTRRALEYTIPESADLTPFGRSVADVYENADVLYPLASNDVLIDHQAQFRFTTMYGSGSYTSPAAAFWQDASMTAETYFGGIPSKLRTAAFS